MPFSRTRSEREATGDPRPSLEERYGSQDIYVARVEAAAAALVADRLLLPADAAAYVKAARECDRFLLASGADQMSELINGGKPTLRWSVTGNA